MPSESEGYYEADTIGYFISKLYDGWRDCDECQRRHYICSDHMYLIEPLLDHEGRRRGERVKDFHYDPEDEPEWLRDIELGGES